MSVAPVLVVRHAPVHVPGICYGQLDVPTALSANAAAAAVLEQLARDGTRITRVWTSPWRRTQGPATRLADVLGVPLVADARLSELAFGQWEGRAYRELDGDPAFQQWMREWREAAPPGGERLAELVDRVRSWRAEVLSRQEAAVALTHAGVIRVLRAEARGVDYDAVAQETVQPLMLERVR
ncbi:histidine phosphatase family protein [Bradyrhizobium sp.]|uniref:histidine phosphatase family protein n=1 Tax=Bradyrhizobium sp. TaxID=376 RepID=UPI0025C3190F|nr:histidine phosphatase family protein [Bradyrhizobium sp.]